MNVFLIQPNVRQSCEELAALDPVRARCQLKECCQVLASVEWATTGACTMIKKDGTTYGRSHPHHPCVTHATKSRLQYWLTVFVARNLADLFPAHACARSLNAWDRWRVGQSLPSGNFVVVRRDHAHVYTSSREEYAALLRPYFLAKVAASHTANAV